MLQYNKKESLAPDKTNYPHNLLSQSNICLAREKGVKNNPIFLHCRIHKKIKGSKKDYVSCLRKQFILTKG